MNSPYGLSLAEDCLLCRLRSDEFFCALPRPSLEAFERIKHPCSYPAGAVIFLEGQPPRGVFVLCQGQAKLSTTDKGRTLILRMVKPGEVLGLSTTIVGSPYELTCATMQPCQLNFVEREDFLCFLKEHGDVCLHAAQHLSHDCERTYDLIRYFGLSHFASERLARFLLESAVGKQASHGVVRVKLTLTRTEISQLVGLDRVTVSRTLGEFRKKKVAELDGATLIIRNRAALERLVAS